MSQSKLVRFDKNSFPDDRLKLDICPKCGRTCRLVADPLIEGAKVAIHAGRYTAKAFIATDRCCIEKGPHDDGLTGYVGDESGIAGGAE